MATSSIFANTVLTTESEAQALIAAYEDSLKEEAIAATLPVFHTVGGRTVYLECEDVPALCVFYEREGYRKMSQRYSVSGMEDEGTLYHVYVKFLKAA